MQRQAVEFVGFIQLNFLFKMFLVRLYTTIGGPWYFWKDTSAPKVQKLLVLLVGQMFLKGS